MPRSPEHTYPPNTEVKTDPELLAKVRRQVGELSQQGPDGRRDYFSALNGGRLRRLNPSAPALKLRWEFVRGYIDFD